MLLYQILVTTTHGKIQKSYTKTIDLKYQLQHGMRSLICLTDHILYQIFKDYFQHIFKKHGEKNDNTTVRIYINKIENRITIKIKTGYYLELLTPKAINMLGSTEKQDK